MNEPSASVAMPVMPCPTVQPMAVTPPKPISTAPKSCWRRSDTDAKPSQRKRPVARATTAAPATTPSTEAMPSVRCSEASVQSISSSSP